MKLYQILTFILIIISANNVAGTNKKVCIDLILEDLLTAENNTTIDHIVREQKRFNALKKESPHSERVPAAVLTLLGNYTKRGNQLYTKNGKFVFKNKMIEAEYGGGINNGGIFKVLHQGKLLILKKTSYMNNNSEILINIQNSKYMEHLGIGPRTELVELADGSKYFVMEEAAGINTKEVFAKMIKNDSIKTKIDKQLGFKTETIDEARKLFARKILKSKDFIQKMREIENLLFSNGFYYTRDLQLMMDLSEQRLSIEIIDTEYFKRYDDFIDTDYPPKESFARIVKSLKELAK